MEQSLVKIPAINVGELEPFVPQVAKSVKLLSYIGVITEDKVETAQKMITDCKLLTKAVNEALDKVNRPYINIKNDINAEQGKAKERAAEILKPLEDAIKKTTESILAYNKAAQEKKKRDVEELQKKLKEQSGGVYNPDNNSKPVSVSTAVPPLPKVKGIRKIVKYSIVDAVKVPRGYCSPDDALIQAAFKAGVREIPGLKIWEDEIIVG